MIVWATALCLRVRMGPAFNAKELTLLMLNFGFLVDELPTEGYPNNWSGTNPITRWSPLVLHKGGD